MKSFVESLSFVKIQVTEIQITIILRTLGHYIFGVYIIRLKCLLFWLWITFDILYNYENIF